MYALARLIVASAIAVTATVSNVVGQQQPIQNQQFQQTSLQSIRTDHVAPRRIAIIGAGAGGASTAYHLSQFVNQSHYDVPLDITIFDINERAGGRTTTVNAFDDPKYPVEVGASIFVKVNHILYNASRDFDLSTDRAEAPSTGSVYEMGVWDGADFVFQSENNPDGNKGITGRLGGWWDIAKLLWKYGLSPIRTNQLMKTTVAKFLQLYDEQFPFEDLDQVTAHVGLDEFVGVTGKEALTRGGISEEFARHAVQASTRVNYAQNLGNIHGLETMVCMATDGAMAVQGGNWKIFDQFVKRANVNTRYNTSVQSVRKLEKGTFRVTSKSLTSEQMTNADDEFDTIILAAPYQFANVTFQPTLSRIPPKVDYVKLHVTLFTSPLLPSPPFFGLEGQWEVPDTILTTLPPGFNVTDSARGKQAVGPTKFWSISTRALDTDGPETQYLYKIFSPEPISITFLAKMFNYAVDDVPGNEQDEDGFVPFELAPTQLVSWYHLKVWRSYPYLPPTTALPPIRLDDDVYYTSAIEPFISTMETSALSGRNVARLIVDDLEWKAREMFGKPGLATATDSDAEFVDEL